MTTTSGSAAADRAPCGYIRQQLVIAVPKSGGAAAPGAARYLTAGLTTGPMPAVTGRADVSAGAKPARDDGGRR